VPPLYRVKIGSKEQYVEKESQFEDLLVRERIKDMQVTDRNGAAVKFTEARWGKFTRALHEFDGWSLRLKADFGVAAGEFVIAQRLVETEAANAGELAEVLSRIASNGHELQLVSSDAAGSRIRIVERETSAANHVIVPSDLLSSPVYDHLRKAYARLVEIVGAPPFLLELGKKSRKAETFQALRSAAVDLAKEGIGVTRFKGLGEMDAAELWDTTMNPANRMLIRVEVEDAARADQIFSMLMGDQVEPRRDFIVKNAKDVRFLDV
jgi:DNA gyrase subunit B